MITEQEYLRIMKYQMGDILHKYNYDTEESQIIWMFNNPVEFLRMNIEEENVL